MRAGLRAQPKTTCTYGSVLYSQTFTRPGTPTPAPHQWIGNQSVETDMSGWTGKYGSSPYVTVTRDSSAAHSGSYSLKVTGLIGASNLSSGFNDSPRWVTATVVGTTYTQTAWVKPTFAGQKITMRLREWSGSTLVTDKYVPLTAATTGWRQLSQTLTAAGSSHQLSFAIYSNGISAGQSFYADDFSLTTPNQGLSVVLPGQSHRMRSAYWPSRPFNIMGWCRRFRRFPARVWA